MYIHEEYFMTKTKVFQSGNSQAVRLPKEFNIDNQEVYIKKVGNVIMLIPVDISAWDIMEAGIKNFPSDCFDDPFFSEKRPLPQEREGLDDLFD